MTNSQHEATLEELLNGEPRDVWNWIQKLNGAETLPTGFNWHGFADSAAQRARNNAISRGQALEWGKIAATIYDRLAASSSGAESDAFLFSSMMLRASMIVNFGAREGDVILDPNRILTWFFQNQAVPYDEVSKEAPSWRKLPLNRIRELRATKNRLNVVEALCESNQFIPDETMRRWLDLREVLP